MQSHPTLALGLVLATIHFAALTPVEADTPNRLPIKEVTVFKDGHAFVLHEGRLPVDAQGRGSLDYLPTPVIGTFWAYAADPGDRLISVVAERRLETVARTALTLRELLEANVGAEIIVTETNHLTYPATILGFPARTSEELAETTPPPAIGRLPQSGNLVLLQTVEGTKAVALERIQDVTFKQPPQPKVTQAEFRNALILNFSRGGGASDSAGAGLMYLQRGVRWIPSYRVDLDGEGRAHIRLQATVLNELTDLEDVTLQLVIGVPSFTFKDTLDPMALQETLAQLSAFFQSSAGTQRREDALLSNFSNNFMTQTPRMGEYRAGNEGAGVGDPELPEGARNEDLFVFSVPHVTLKKGARMVLPIAECVVPYEDIFTLDLPYAPPPELGRHLVNPQPSEVARLLASPRVMHKARLTNSSGQPFTTAPALILREGRVLGQGLMPYTASGASTDLALTTAVDIQVNKSDREIKRTPNAYRHADQQYLRVDLQGSVRLTNHRDQPLALEVTRHVLGRVNSADHGGQVIMSNVFESRDHLPAGDQGRGAYGGDAFNWPWWWHQVNGVGRITWKLEVAPGQALDLGYAWHYFWP
ncbi:MAG: hypothetical protein KJ072_21870 [Verrucomicrobia bacterium]|nr:hypothetical protein [Verrucomicrobiota bacterium]